MYDTAWKLTCWLRFSCYSDRLRQVSESGTHSIMRETACVKKTLGPEWRRHRGFPRIAENKWPSTFTPLWNAGVVVGGRAACSCRAFPKDLNTIILCYSNIFPSPSFHFQIRVIMQMIVHAIFTIHLTLCGVVWLITISLQQLHHIHQTIVLILSSLQSCFKWKHLLQLVNLTHTQCIMQGIRVIFHDARNVFSVHLKSHIEGKTLWWKTNKNTHLRKKVNVK